MSSIGRRFLSTIGNEPAYTLSMKLMHWGSGIGILGCFGTVQAAMYTTKEKQIIPGYTKGKLMNLHKSFGLLVAASVVPRLFLRLSSKLPAPLPGSFLEILLAKLGHYSQYAGNIALPASGIAMGYYGGKGLPFFGYTIPGATEENKNPEIAKNAFKFHKKAGQVFEFLTLGHVGAVGFHMLKGQAIWRRIIPGMT